MMEAMSGLCQFQFPHGLFIIVAESDWILTGKPSRTAKELWTSPNDQSRGENM